MLFSAGIAAYRFMMLPIIPIAFAKLYSDAFETNKRDLLVTFIAYS